ncbi:MAG: adenylate/guanylate cyclase domain-containing protein [candidate division KSB1 bacterium]|nr:adenylate/guanylate cyclase domain-containing protein [candidate division KSB1 bacterium]MDZ7274227.1 adenylate/guanylate cyclase domain-containing protein [candidate division KSB1 bacterium]MDZ7287251.1 adenylate/guanylate cyclase domain-containing protein [candidate division KSB1 bacterium]MDZ7296825.1 adenylate/guanylate cyclase domain-containing protein [candidate division KSB1 bacterium]MDZ7347691.1 adenylate/guanylate cyclase domain-containing protein [candidate division KSB1 bacterium
MLLVNMEILNDNLLRCVPVHVLAKWQNSLQRELLLKKREKPLAILFADIEGCTRLCEDLPPKEMNELIETYFSRFFEVVEESGGTVNEIMGDGFMAVFEENDLPKNILAASVAALNIQRHANELNTQRSKEYEPVVVNIGIHAGIAFVGFTKFRTSAGERWTYTASGTVSNIAARLCALATNGGILVSDAVAEIIKTRYALHPLGQQKLKNVSQPVFVFKIEQSTTTNI